MYGRPVDLNTEPYSTRRTIYGRIDRSDVADMLINFDFANPDLPSGRRHETTVPQNLADLQAAIEHLPRSAYAEEARPLAEELQRIEQGRRRGPQLLGDILPIVLARLGVGALQSTESGEHDLT